MRTLAERLEIFNNSTIYPVITPQFCSGRQVQSVVQSIIDGGAKIVQLRCKHESDFEFYKLATICRNITMEANLLLIIDDRIDIALAVDADGVHLGQSDLPVRTAKMISKELIVGISTHNLEEIKSAHVNGADYLNIGPVFTTKTKSVGYNPIGLEMLSKLILNVSIPFSVMGGIKMEHLPILRRMGVAHVAMITEITQSTDIVTRTRELIENFK